MHSYSYVDLFFEKYLYLISEEKNWAKADSLLSNMPGNSKTDIPEVIIKAISFRNKLELGDLVAAKELATYFISCVNNIKEDVLLNIVLCNMFDYAFRILSVNGLYAKLADKDPLAVFADNIMTIIKNKDFKTYASHVMYVYDKLEKAKVTETSLSSNYILSNYYMIINPLRNKYSMFIKDIERKVLDGVNFISND